MNTLIVNAGTELSTQVTSLCANQAEELERLAQRLTELFAEGGRLLTTGTGMLQFVAQMTAAQFAHRLDFHRPALPAICLGSDALLFSTMVTSGDYEQSLVRHYRILANDRHLVLFFSDGQPDSALKRLRDELLDQDVPVVLVSAAGTEDPLHSDENTQCLNLAVSAKARQIELMQFTGHLLCELVEAELFQR